MSSTPPCRAPAPVSPPQKLQAVTAASSEERRRLEASFKDKIAAVERRVKELGDKERAYKRSASQLVGWGAVRGGR